MKCENCGGNLYLEDKVCPYCGEPNEHAVQHIKDMQYYSEEFEDTRQTVYAVAQKHSGIMMRVIIIAVLLVLCIICGVISHEAYSITRKVMVSKANRNVEKHITKMDSLLEEKEYFEFYRYCYQNGISPYEDEYSDYYNLYEASSTYVRIFQNLSTLQIENDNEYTDKAYFVTNIEIYLDTFYDVYDNVNSENGGSNEKEQEIIQDINKRIKVLLMTYIGLSKEEVDSLAHMYSTERRVLIEENYLNEY